MAALLVIAACGGTSDSGLAPASTAESSPAAFSAKASVSPSNSLIVDIEVTVDTPSRVYVEYENPRTGRFRSKTTESLDTSHLISLVRLRPSATYSYEVFAVD